MKLSSRLSNMAFQREMDGLKARLRIAAHLQNYLNKKKKDGKELSLQELEERLGVGAGTASRVLASDRLGLDVFLKIRALVNLSADTLLDEDPD